MFARIFTALAEDADPPQRTWSTARQLVCCKKGRPRRDGRTKGDPKSKLHIVCVRPARSLILLLSEGQKSNHRGADLLIGALPPARETTAEHISGKGPGVLSHRWLATGAAPPDDASDA